MPPAIVVTVGTMGVPLGGTVVPPNDVLIPHALAFRRVGNLGPRTSQDVAEAVVAAEGIGVSGDVISAAR